MVRFQTPTLISIGLKTTLGCLTNIILKLTSLCNVYAKLVFKISVSFTKVLADVKEILTKL